MKTVSDFTPEFSLTTPTQVVVLGAARSGMAAVRFLKRHGFDVRVSDSGAMSQTKQDSLQALNVPFEHQGHTEAFLQTATFIVASPGIPLTAPPYAWAKKHCIAVVSEVELAWQFMQTLPNAPRLLAVTGSNGKSTVVSLLEALLKQAGYAAQACGNIGKPFIQCLDRSVSPDFDFLILEISSFQLETTYTLRPEGALLLNVYENHLDRHQSMETYFSLKSRLFAHQKNTDLAVLSKTNPWCQRLSNTLPAQVEQFALPVGEQLIYKGKPLMPIADIKLKGQHNLENIQAVLKLVEHIDVEPDAIVKTLTCFQGMPHRLEPVSVIQDRHFINDSKSTNYLAAEKAFQAMERPVVWIAGGKDKGGDFSNLAAQVAQKATHVVLMGECQHAFAHGLIQSGYNQITQVDGMAKAVQVAFSLAAPGDVILLSPATASYDAYANFEVRGDDFKHHVAQLVSKV